MISVIMPVYNAAQFLRDSIESVLNQTEEDFELIIVNDGSTDESEQIILTYSDSRIKYLKKENGGEASARNMGLGHAGGNFIVWQDADDVSLPTRFEVLKRQFNRDTVGFVHSDFLLVNERNQPIGYWQSRNIDKQRMLRFFLRIGTAFNNPSMMLRREVLEGFQYDESLLIGTDSDMIFQSCRNWDSVHVPEPLVLYRRHSNNLTAQPDQAEKAAIHVRKFLERHSLEELIPELDWINGNPSENKARAMAIISLFLFRRSLIDDAEAWFNKSCDLAGESGSTDFVLAIGNIIVGKYLVAYEKLAQYHYKSRYEDHVVENYLGEIAALMGKIDLAYSHFLRAIELNPHYEEPIDNLRAIGAMNGFRLIDVSLQKYTCNLL